MRMTRLFSQTLREAPADAEVASHILLVRAGFIRQHLVSNIAKTKSLRKTVRPAYWV